MKKLMMLFTLLVFSLSIGCSDTGTEPDSRQPNTLSTQKKKLPPTPESVFAFWGSNVGITQTGEAWRLSIFSGGILRWDRIPSFDPPVPVSEIAFFDLNNENNVSGTGVLVTKAGDAWVRDGRPWVNAGPPTGASIVEMGETK